MFESKTTLLVDMNLRIFIKFSKKNFPLTNLKIISIKLIHFLQYFINGILLFKNIYISTRLLQYFTYYQV